jgi:hypothetical protein
MAGAKRKVATRAAKKAPAGERRVVSGAAGKYTVGGDGCQLSVIRPRKTKHGPRPRRGKNEFAQYAIQVLNPSKDITDKKLLHDVNYWLDNNPDYRATGLGKISLSTILRAQKTVRS